MTNQPTAKSAQRRGATAAALALALALGACASNSPPRTPLLSATEPKVLENREKAIAIRVANWSAARQPRGARRLGEIRSATISGPKLQRGGDVEAYCVGLNEYFETPDALFPDKVDAKYGLYVRIFRKDNLISISRQNFCEAEPDTRPLPYVVDARRLQQARMDRMREQLEADKAAAALAASRPAITTPAKRNTRP